MHDIEPFFKWRKHYIASEDKYSPFFGRSYSEFAYSQKIYNYFIHPQWDEMGSNTLYLKILHCDYEEGYCCIELFGEWNDAITNDIMFLKREIADILSREGISKYVLLCENVLNFHADEDCYYEEWYEDVSDELGWVCLLNVRDHIVQEMETIRLQNYMHFGELYNEFNWRKYEPNQLYKHVEDLMAVGIKQLNY